MAVIRESDRERKIRIWATVIGSIAAILAVVMFCSGVSETELIERDNFQVISFHVQTLFVFLSVVVAFTGYILSWWHKLPACIFLVLAWIFLLVIDVLPDLLKTPESAASGDPYNMFGIPALVAGLLFLWYLWSYKRRTIKDAKP